VGEDLLGVAQVVGEVVTDCAAHPGTRKIYCFIPHELELVQTVQVGEDLLGVVQVVGEDVMVVPHTLSQGKFIVLSLISLSSSRQSRWGKTFLAWPR
jgi:hypothetical protein